MYLLKDTSQVVEIGSWIVLAIGALIIKRGIVKVIAFSFWSDKKEI